MWAVVLPDLFLKYFCDILEAWVISNETGVEFAWTNRVRYGVLGGLRFNPTKNESTVEFARSVNFFFCVAFVLDKKKMEDLNSFLYQKKKTSTIMV